MNPRDEKETGTPTVSDNDIPSAGENHAQNTSDESAKPWEESFPPPHIPSRLLMWVIGGCIIVTLAVIALFIIYVISHH